MRHFSKLAAGLLLSASLSTVASADTIRFWTTEEQPDRLAKQQPWLQILKPPANTPLKLSQFPKRTRYTGNCSFCSQ